MKKRPQYISVFIIAIILPVLAACSVGSEYKRPEVNAPKWNGTEANAPHISSDWWKEYESEELTGLITTALEQNHDLQASLHRIAQARADLKIAGASLLPSAKIAGSASFQKEIVSSNDSREFRVTPQFSFATRDWIANAGISYELDLFGKNRAGIKAQAANVLEQEYASDALSLVIAGDVAYNYFKYLNLEKRKRIAQDNLDLSRSLLKTIEARFATGYGTSLDIADQRTIISNRKADLATVEKESTVTKNALAVLAGKPPQTFEIKGGDFNSIQIPPMAVLQP